MMHQDMYSPDINDNVQGTKKISANIVHPTLVTVIWESSTEKQEEKLLVLYKEEGAHWTKEIEELTLFSHAKWRLSKNIIALSKYPWAYIPSEHSLKSIVQSDK